jgi:hypothetical protein
MNFQNAVAAALGALMLCTTGCLHVGQEFPVRGVPGIEMGATTQDEIRDRFGTPWRTGRENGQRTWTYGDYRYSLFGPARTRDLVVRFDDQGHVASYAFSSTWAEDRDL